MHLIVSRVHSNERDLKNVIRTVVFHTSLQAYIYIYAVTMLIHLCDLVAIIICILITVPPP